MSSPETPSHVILENRLHAIWEKSEALAVSLCNKNVAWFEGRATTAPRILHKMADEYLGLACELDAIAQDVETEAKQRAEATLALSKAFNEIVAQIERDQLTARFAEIERTARRPPTK